MSNQLEFDRDEMYTVTPVSSEIKKYPLRWTIEQGEGIMKRLWSILKTNYHFWKETHKAFRKQIREHKKNPPGPRIGNF